MFYLHFSSGVYSNHLRHDKTVWKRYRDMMNNAKGLNLPWMLYNQ